MSAHAAPTALFAPPTRAWFDDTFDGPTEPQAVAWPAIRAGRHVLVAAPTGSGKTLAAFLSAIDDLVSRALDGSLADETYVVYVSPLKALGNDIEKNLQAPLRGILARAGLPADTIRTAVRSGDTPAAERRAQLTRPVHIFVTTPESLYILLTSEGGRRMLATARTVIVDEIHAVVADKRGSHLALTVERLRHLVGGSLQRIGLSATQRPIAQVAQFLVGATPSGDAHHDRVAGPDCVVIDTGHRRTMDLRVEVPDSPLSAVMSTESWGELHRRIADLVSAHATTLVFVNTRRLAERLTAHLEELLGRGAVMSHHGSLSRQHRLLAEQRLKNGELKALVATASLELGIDIGDVDLVCQIGSTRSIASLLQRVGRSGHGVGLIPKGRLFPLTRDELVECAALLHAVRQDELDRLTFPERPLDILAQQIVAEVACGDVGEDELFDLVRGAWPFRDLERREFDDVVRMIAEGFATRRGRRGAYVHHDAVNHRLRPRRGARITAMTSGGAIPDVADYDVFLESSGTRIGSINEDFAIESMVGDVFQLGNNSWQILKVEPGRVFVRDATGMPPSIPFWLGEAPARTREFSQAVSAVREAVAARVAARGVAGAVDWLVAECGLSPEAARQAAEYLAAGMAALGAMPSQSTVVLERFFDESGGMQLVLHSPFGARVNRAWGLALRKRFCRKFNFELQAAATEDAIVLSLGVTHSFPLAEVLDYLAPESVRDVLVQALLDAPMFATRWRWNGNRALAIPRFRGGKRVPAAIQRMNAEDLVSVVFPDQLACLENIVGEREVPDHPLVRQTVRDCLEEAMDIDTLESVLREIRTGAIRAVTAELIEPSPLAAEILNAAPYAFLDDAPLEERRTNAVRSRRWLDPDDAAGLGRLDAKAAAAVRAAAWPTVRDADELHDALVVAGAIAPDVDRVPGDDDEAGPGESVRDAWAEWFAELHATGRAVEATPAPGTTLWVAVERLTEVRAAYGDTGLGGEVSIPARHAGDPEPDTAWRELVRGRLEVSGPVSVEALTCVFGSVESRVRQAVAALESEGFALRGDFLGEGAQWCERGLLARIHRLTLEDLRSRVRPVSPAAWVRHLLHLQRVTPGERVEGIEGLMAVIEQLQGVAVPAGAWESHVLPSRVRDYDPAMLDVLCLSGRVAWARAPRRGAGGAGPVRATPIVLAPREAMPLWLGAGAAPLDGLSRDALRLRDVLTASGASFFGDIARAAGLLPAQAESALAELVAMGHAVSDGFAGLRALITPAALKRRGRRGRDAAPSVADGGRWSLAPVGAPVGSVDSALSGVDERAPAIAEALLARYGVVFKAALEREEGLPPWRDLLRALRRMEARGDVRGGRFVDGFSGEQFAATGTVNALRRFRDPPAASVLVSLSAADPANPVGPVLRGARVGTLANNRVLLSDGEVVAILEANEVRFVTKVDDARRWELETALVRVQTPVAVRRYLGQGSAVSPRSAT